MISDSKRQVKSGDFVTVVFYGCFITRNHFVLWFIECTLNDDLKQNAKHVGNFRMLRRHGAEDTSKVISIILDERIENRFPDFFV